MLKLLRDDFNKELLVTYNYLKNERKNNGVNEQFFIVKYETMSFAINELIDLGVNSYYSIYPFILKFKVDMVELIDIRDEIMN